MSVDYESLLTADQKREILSARLAQFAAEGYQVSLNKKTAIELNSEEQVEKISEALELLDAAIKIHQEELAKLPPPMVQQ
jgi:DNA primase large subunit